MKLEKIKWNVKRGDLTPDSQTDLPLEVSGRKDGDVAGVCGLIGLLCVQNQQRGVDGRFRALELNTIQKIRRRWNKTTEEEHYIQLEGNSQETHIKNNTKKQKQMVVFFFNSWSFFERPIWKSHANFSICDITLPFSKCQCNVNPLKPNRFSWALIVSSEV